ncbi:MAG: hypothetical protein QM762_27550 [Chryseolinea sp.]
MIGIWTFIKFALAFAGLATTLLWLAIGLIRKDKTRLKNAAILFFSTALALIAIGVIEFLLIYWTS